MHLKLPQTKNIKVKSLKPLTLITLKIFISFTSIEEFNKILRNAPHKLPGRSIITHKTSEHTYLEILNNIERPENSKKVLEFIKRGGLKSAERDIELEKFKHLTKDNFREILSTVSSFDEASAYILTILLRDEVWIQDLFDNNPQNIDCIVNHFQQFRDDEEEEEFDLEKELTILPLEIENEKPQVETVIDLQESKMLKKLKKENKKLILENERLTRIKEQFEEIKSRELEREKDKLQKYFELSQEKLVKSHNLEKLEIMIASEELEKKLSDDVARLEGLVRDFEWQISELNSELSFYRSVDQKSREIDDITRSEPTVDWNSVTIVADDDLDWKKILKDMDENSVDSQSKGAVMRENGVTEGLPTFEFLKEELPDIYDLGLSLDNIIFDNYRLAIVLSRIMAEFLAKKILFKTDSKATQDQGFSETLKMIRYNASVDYDIIKKFYWLKEVGNKAIHSDSFIPSEKFVLEGHKYVFDIAVWYMKTTYPENFLIPIYPDVIKGKNRLLDAVKDVMITAEEQVELSKAVHDFDLDGFERVVKIISRLNDVNIESSENWMKIDFTDFYGNAIHFDNFQTIKDAIINKKNLRIIYNGISLKIEPIRLLLKENVWYIEAYCYAKNVMQCLRLSRVERIILEKSVFLNKAANVNIVAPNNKKTPSTFKYLINKTSRAHILDVFGYIPKMVNGKFEVTVSRFYDNDESKKIVHEEIFSFGKDIEVIEPTSLRETIHSELRDASNVYGVVKMSPDIMENKSVSIPIHEVESDTQLLQDNVRLVDEVETLKKAIAILVR